MKLAFIGFIGGALVAALLFQRVRPVHAGVPRENAAHAADPSPTDLAALDLELKAIQLQADAERDAIAELRARRPEADAPPPTKAEARAEIVRDVLALMKETRYVDFAHPGDQEAKYKLLSLMRSLAAELGVEIEELDASPEGKAALLSLFFEQAQPPLSESARVAMDQAVKRLGEYWESYTTRRAEMTRLERCSEFWSAEQEYSRAMEASLTAEQLEAFKWLDYFWEVTQPSQGLSNRCSTVESTEQVAAEWKEDWGLRLKLDPRQQLALEPIVEEYVRELAFLKAVTPEIDYQVLLDLSIRTQKKIGAMIDLTPAQARALAAQTETWDYQIWGWR